MIEGVGGAFDSEYFDKDEISFDDPDERWKIAFNWQQKRMNVKLLTFCNPCYTYLKRGVF